MIRYDSERTRDMSRCEAFRGADGLLDVRLARGGHRVPTTVPPLPRRGGGERRWAVCGGHRAPAPAVAGEATWTEASPHAGFVYRHRGGAALPSRGPCLHLACRSMARVLPASEGKDNSPERPSAHASRCMLTRGVATIDQRSRSGVTERCMRLLVRQSHHRRSGRVTTKPPCCTLRFPPLARPVR